MCAMHAMVVQASIALHAANPCPLVTSTRRSANCSLGLVAPVTLELALSVEAEMQARDDEVAVLREQSVQRCREAAELAKRRFMEVDPGNRLVADVLESEWNQGLLRLRNAEEGAGSPSPTGPDPAR